MFRFSNFVILTVWLEKERRRKENYTFIIHMNEIACPVFSSFSIPFILFDFYIEKI